MATFKATSYNKQRKLCNNFGKPETDSSSKPDASRMSSALQLRITCSLSAHTLFFHITRDLFVHPTLVYPPNSDTTKSIQAWKKFASNVPEGRQYAPLRCRYGLKITHPPRFSLKFKVPRLLSRTRADRVFIPTEVGSTVWIYFRQTDQKWQHASQSGSLNLQQKNHNFHLFLYRSVVIPTSNKP
jgi:hypothetical protein